MPTVLDSARTIFGYLDLILCMNAWHNLMIPALVQQKKSGYDNSSLLNVLAYHILYLILCPFIGLYEIGVAGINALTRDFTCFSNKIDIVTEMG